MEIIEMLSKIFWLSIVSQHQLQNDRADLLVRAPCNDAAEAQARGLDELILTTRMASGDLARIPRGGQTLSCQRNRMQCAEENWGTIRRMLLRQDNPLLRTTSCLTRAHNVISSLDVKDAGATRGDPASGEAPAPREDNSEREHSKTPCLMQEDDLKVGTTTKSEAGVSRVVAGGEGPGDGSGEGSGPNPLGYS